MKSTEFGRQSTLFPEVGTFTEYEQPLNERVRNCLRLEHLFATIQDGCEGGSQWSARAAIVGMLEASDMLARTDIKGDLIKELDRHSSKISRFNDNPKVDQDALGNVLATVQALLIKLKSSDCHPGEIIRTDELINQVRQRISIPGGSCNFDLPAFHHWLSKSPDLRADQFQHWIADLLVIEQAVALVLQMLRQSAVPRCIPVENGFFQQQLDPGIRYQLIRVSIADNLGVFPEISGGKHRFVIRFLRQPHTVGRPTPAHESLSFDLQCCGI